MAVFVIGPDDETNIKNAVRQAKYQMIPYEIVKKIAETGDRSEAPEPIEVHLPLGWRLNISCEEQEIGPCLHISMSSPTSRVNRVPRLEAMQMILEIINEEKVVHIWLEDFNEAGISAGKAVNMLIKIKTS